MIQLEKYRDPWIAQGVNDQIGFYNREFFCLDNFSAFKIIYQGHLYSSVEEAYQAIGFIDTAPEVAKAIINSKSALEAKEIAHSHIEERRPDWDDVKLALMESLCRAKLEQHPYVQKKLLQTGDYPIVEDSPTDNFWGCGCDRAGQNEMGKIWMRLRAEIQTKQQHESGKP